MTDLRVSASVTADGKQAAAELNRLAGQVGRTKQELVEAQSAAKAAAAALKEHTAATVVDAAETVRLRDALIAARAAEAAATRQYAISQQGLNGIARGAGQARASMANLGQQVGDVAQGVALGVPAFTLLAQQGGQVAFALSGLGGVVGRVATFLSGPWGAAITGAAIVLGSLWSASDKAAGSATAQTTAQMELAKALKALDEAAGRAATSQEETVAAGRQAAEQALKTALAKRQEVAALIAQAKAELELQRVRAGAPGQRGEVSALGLDVAGRRLAGLQAFERDNDASISLNQSRLQSADFFTASRTLKASRDAVAKATLEAERAEVRLRQAVAAGTMTAQQAGAELGRYLAAIDQAREAKGAATLASRGQEQALRALDRENQRLTESYNPLLAALTDYRAALDDIAKAEARGIISAGAAADARVAAEAKARQARVLALGGTAARPLTVATAADLQNTLSARVFAGDFAREMDRVLGPEGLGRQLAAQLGQLQGQSFTDFMRRNADDLGVVLGAGLAAGFGRSLQRSQAFANVLDRLLPGQGQGAAFSEAFRKSIDDAFRPLTKGLQELFKSLFGEGSDLGKALGKLAGGAAVGGAIADVSDLFGLGLNRKNAVRGGLIGGAVGALTGLGPIGAVIGAVGGGLIRPKNPFADVALQTTASGASGTVFGSRGGADSIRTGQGFAGGVNDALAQVAQALGAEVRAGLNLGSIGFSGSQYYFNPAGGDFKAPGGQRFDQAEDAVAAAVASALASGAITASPRVQLALNRYAGNVNQAVAEALKVRDLEQLLEAQGNPFAAAFRDFERQARSRVDIARQYGFDLIEIEKLNAQQRADLIRDTLDQATGSARALLDDFRFGDRAGGSARDRLASLGAERDRLAGLVRGGDGGQLDALAEVIRQIDDLQREAFGATGEAAGGRAASAALLQELIDATEARVRAASEEARRAQADSIATQKSMDATLEDIFQTSRQQLDALNTLAARLIPAGGGIYDFGLAESAAR